MVLVNVISIFLELFTTIYRPSFFLSFSIYIFSFSVFYVYIFSFFFLSFFIFFEVIQFNKHNTCMSHFKRISAIAYAKTKTQVSFAVTSAFVFVSWIVQCLISMLYIPSLHQSSVFAQSDLCRSYSEIRNSWLGVKNLHF